MKLYTSKISDEPLKKEKKPRSKKVKLDTIPEVEEPKVEEPVEPAPVETEPKTEKVEPLLENEKTLINEPLEIKEETKEFYIPPSAPPTPPPEKHEVPRPRLQRNKKESEEPPKWFKTFMSNTKLNEQTIKPEKKPKKEIKKEAVEYAKDQWKDPYIRNRFTNQSERHLDQLNHLYGQIFKR